VQVPTGGGQRPTGAAAITPHLSGVPAFTTDDMASYVKSHPLPATLIGGGQPAITRNAFITTATLGQVLGTSFGLPDATLVGYVELQGRFTFPPFAPDGKAPTFTHAFVLFDAQSGNLLAYGGLQAQTPTVTATPTPTLIPQTTPTATPTPVVKFSVHPTSFAQSCDPSSSPLPALGVTLDNTGSSIAVSWSIQITDKDPKTNSELWAAASPSSGTTPAGGTTTVSITPASDLCNKLVGITTSMLHAKVVLTSGGSGASTVTDSVTPFFIG
jgi:hypothetical protein